VEFSSASAPSSDDASHDRPATGQELEGTPVERLLAQAARLAAAGRPRDAIQPLRAALRHMPPHAPLQHDLGYLCLQAGLPREAAAAFAASLGAQPDFALAALRLGIALEAVGDPPGALAAWERCLRLQPDLAEAHFRRADLLETLGRREAAADAFRAAAALRPRTSLTRLCHARALLAEDRDAEAERVLRRLLRLEPDHPMATDLLGLVLAESGRLVEARDCFERATRAAPNLAGSYYELVRCRRLGAADRDLPARMRAALAGGTLPDPARLKLHLALGQALDDLGEPGPAMAEFGHAARLRSRLGSFDIEAFERQVEDLVRLFTADMLRAAPPAGPPLPGRHPEPILILGLPRSGTTLVEQILACHTEVAGGGELPFWTGRGAAAWQSGPAASLPDPAFVRGAAADYSSLLERIVRRTPTPRGVTHVTDKMPLNIFWVGLVHLALPQARFVLCRRSPIDTALSIHRTYFNPHAAFPTGGEALVRAVRAVERLGAHWRQALPPGRLVEVRYEALVGEPEREIRTLLEACGLPWQPACLHPERNRRTVRTPSKWQVRQPISPASVGVWRRYRPWLGALAGLLAGEEGDEGPGARRGALPLDPAGV